MSDYAKKNLHVYVEEELQKTYASKGKLTDDDYKKAIEIGFDRVESEFLKFSREAFQKGFPNAAYVGACALVAIVSGNKLYVASAGDCKAGIFIEILKIIIAVVKDTQKGFEGIKVSKRFSANKKSEQYRLKKEFPSEPDVVICVFLNIRNKNRKVKMLAM